MSAGRAEDVSRGVRAHLQRLGYLRSDDAVPPVDRSADTRLCHDRHPGGSREVLVPSPPSGRWDETLERLDEALAVREALEAMPDACARFLDRFFCRDESYVCIGRAWNCRPGTIAAHLRCRAKLRQQLEGKEQPLLVMITRCTTKSESENCCGHCARSEARVEAASRLPGHPARDRSDRRLASADAGSGGSLADLEGALQRAGLAPNPVLVAVLRRSPVSGRRRARELPAWSLAAEQARTVESPAWPARITREWAWGGATGAGVRVAIVDSGVEHGHPLWERCSARSRSATPNGTGAGGREGDLCGHGTASPASCARWRRTARSSASACWARLHG